MKLRLIASWCRRKFFVLLIVAFATIAVLRYFKETKTREYPSVANNFHEAQLKLDRTQRSRDEVVHDAQKSLPSFPILFWEKNKKTKLFLGNESCAKFPNAYNLRVNNHYWQILNTINGTFYLFSAYYDARKSCPICPIVRIISMVDRVRPTVKTHCHLWFADIQEPVVVETKNYVPIYLYNPKKVVDVVFYGYLVTCPIPPQFVNRVPIFVSLVENVCDIASNSLRVVYNKLDKNEKKKRVAVCVKASYFLYEDLSVKLVEWIELIRLLGAEKIFFYSLHNHENMTKVLKHYEERGAIELSPFTYCGDQPNMGGLQHLYILNSKYKKLVNEDISLNDCFYKNMYKYDYIAVLDVDEVIVPRKEKNWKDLLKALSTKAYLESNKTRTHYISQNALFTSEFDESTEWNKDIPSYMHMLQHVQRNKKTWGNFHKSFYVTEETETVWNHWPTHCLKNCFAYKISLEDAATHHYRDKDYIGAPKLLKSGVETDSIIWKYKKPLMKRTLATLHELGFFG